MGIKLETETRERAIRVLEKIRDALQVNHKVLLQPEFVGTGRRGWCLRVDDRDVWLAVVSCVQRKTKGEIFQLQLYEPEDSFPEVRNSWDSAIIQHIARLIEKHLQRRSNQSEAATEGHSKAVMWAGILKALRNKYNVDGHFYHGADGVRISVIIDDEAKLEKVMEILSR